jgi:hypothetical protein
MELKPGVEFNLSLNMLKALPIIEAAYLIFDTNSVITSCSDGDHKVGSKHYDLPSNAVDIRSRDLFHMRAPFVRYLRYHLGPNYDVVDEHETKVHIHVEYDPK